MALRMFGFIGSMLVLVLMACSQADVPASVPTEAMVDEAADTVGDEQIRQPEGDIEKFWDSFDWAELT
jgi:hypothetical protein